MLVLDLIICSSTRGHTLGRSLSSATDAAKLIKKRGILQNTSEFTWPKLKPNYRLFEISKSMHNFFTIIVSQHRKLTKGHFKNENVQLSKFMVGLSAGVRVEGNIDHNYKTTQVKGVKFFWIDIISKTKSVMLDNIFYNKLTNKIQFDFVLDS